MSIDEALDGDVIHLTGDGTVGGGGSAAGARRACVSDSIEAGTFGGIRKCIISSLSETH